MKHPLATLAILQALLACGCNHQEPLKEMAEKTLEQPLSEAGSGEEQMYAAFAQREKTIVEGIVAPSGLGAAIDGERYHLTFQIPAWRRPGGELVHQDATVRKRCSKAEADEIFNTLSAYSVFQIECKLIESHEGRDTPQIELLRIISTDLNDPAIKKAVEELKKPVTHKDEQFGVFTLDRSVHWYNAQTTWGDAAMVLSLDTGDRIHAFPQNSLEQARKLWKDAKRWDGEIHPYILKNLLDLKNGRWLQAGEKKLTADEFLRRISLSSVVVRSNGSFEFWYEDGDLFLGHSIMVSGSIEGGLDYAGLQG